MMNTDNSLYNTVIKNDFCIGCGGCSYLENDLYTIEKDAYGMYKAKLKSDSVNSSDLASKACPFSDESIDEDKLSELFFDESSSKKNKFLGMYESIYAGYVIENDFRSKGSSGGFGKWILKELLENNEADFVCQVVSSDRDDTLFEYKIFDRSENVIQGSRSAYSPVRLDEILKHIKNHEGRYAISAVPCFSKSIRQISLIDPVIKERVKFVIGMFCGHLKSDNYAKLMGWQLGVHPSDLNKIEFREKLENKKANDKGVYAVSANNDKSETKSSKAIFGGNWGQGLFKYKACDYCDDIVGETSDLSIGDAWLDEYIHDYKGTNIIIIRNKRIYQLIKNAITQQKVKLEEMSEDDVVTSQSGGVRHKKEGLAYRLYLKEQSSEWHPPKRVAPSDAIPKHRKPIYLSRIKIRTQSHILFNNAVRLDNLEYFLTRINKIIYQYQIAQATPYKGFIMRLLAFIGMRSLIQKYLQKK